MTNELQGHPRKLFDPRAPADPRRVLIVLNQRIHARAAFARAFKSCSWHIFVDGGADRVLSLVREQAGSGSEDDDVAGALPDLYLPDLIVGDLDSISPLALSHYVEHGVPVARDPSQYSTDFGKAIAAAEVLRHISPDKDLQSMAPSLPPGSKGVHVWDDVRAALSPTMPISTTESPVDVVLFSTLGGRVDQGLGVLSEMAREQELARAEGRGMWTFWLVSERSVSWVLEGPAAGEERRRHVLQLGGGVFTQNVGILPVFGGARIWTQGLEWDVEAWETSMGGNVSTSNHVADSHGRVVIETTGRVLFTVELDGALVV